MRLSKLPPSIGIFLTNLGVTAATFLTGIILARSLGPAGRGQMATLLLWATTLGSFALCGIHMTLSRRAAAEPLSARDCYHIGDRAVLVLSLFAMAIFAAGSFIAFGRMDRETGLTVALAIGIIPFSMLNAMQIQIELGRGAISNFNIARSLFAILNLLMAAILWVLTMDNVSLFLAAQLITGIVGAGIVYILVRQKTAKVTTGYAPGLLPLLAQSRDFGFSIVFVGLAMQADKLLAGLLFRPSDFGIYLVAATVAQIQHMVGEAFSQLFFVRMAAQGDAGRLDPQWLGLRLRQTNIIYGMVCIASMVTLPWLMPYIYGEDFSRTSVILLILLPALALKGLARPLEETLRGMNKPRAVICSTATAAVLLVAAVIAGYLADDIRLTAILAIPAYGAAYIVALWFVHKYVDSGPIALSIPRLSDIKLLFGEIVHVARAAIQPAPRP